MSFDVTKWRLYGQNLYEIPQFLYIIDPGLICFLYKNRTQIWNKFKSWNSWIWCYFRPNFRQNDIRKFASHFLQGSYLFIFDAQKEKKTFSEEKAQNFNSKTQLCCLEKKDDSTRLDTDWTSTALLGNSSGK